MMIRLSIAGNSKVAVRKAPALILIQAIHQIVIAAVLISFVASPAGAQNRIENREESASSQITDPNIPYRLEKGANEFGVWGGGSFTSPTHIGKTEDSRFVIAGLRYARVLFAGNGLAFKYTLDFIPAAVLSFPKFVSIQVGGPGSAIKRRRRMVI